MAEPVLTHSSLERLNSWHPLTSILDSPKFDPPNFAENCSVAAKKVMTNFLNSGDIRSLQNDCLPPVPGKAALAEPQPSVIDAAPAEEAARPTGDVPSTSHVPEDVFSINFTELDGASQADALFSKGPLRTLSSRTFEALLDDSGLGEAEEWTALQNLPSLPRDETLPRPTDTLVECLREEQEAAAVTAVAVSEDAEAAEQASTAAAPAPVVIVEAAREKAVKARVRADQARRYATQKTATATALTMQAMEILDAAASAKGRSREATRESSGVQTPSVLSERPANKSRGGDVSSPTSSTVLGHKRVRAGGFKEGKAASLKGKAIAHVPEDDETDLEDEVVVDTTFAETTAPAVERAPKVSKKHAVPDKPRGIQATDSIITSNGKKCRRGCLNCQAQKTPQWRMGPDGPKTLCNACGVRYRKGLPL